MKIAASFLLLALSAPLAAQAPATAGETRAEAEAKTVALFKRIDADGDGSITRDEMAAFAAARTGATVLPGAPLSPDAAAMFDDGDTDHDGKITRAEAIASALRGFDEADTNHDGQVTPAERDAAARRVASDVADTPGQPAREVSGPPAPQL